MRLLAILALLLVTVAVPAAIDNRVVNFARIFGENETLQVIETADGGDAAYYSSNGDKQVKTKPGFVYWVMAASGTNPTVAFYDDADGTCSSGQKTGTIPLTAGVPARIPMRFGTGICITVGGTSPTITVGYR